MLTRVIKRDQSLERRPLRLFLSIIVGVSLMTTVFVQDAVASDPKEKIRLALFPFSAKNIASNQVSFVRGQVRKVVEQIQQFNLMSDAAMQSIVSYLGLTKLEECQLPSCLSLIGSQLGVQRVLHGTIEQNDNTTILDFKLVNVNDSKVLLSRRIIHTGPIDQLSTGKLDPLRQDLEATVVESESMFRWYYIAGAVAVVGATIYLLSKGFGSKEREYENEPPSPPPPPGN